MAIIDPKNALLQGMSGKIGNLVFKQMPNGKTHVSLVQQNTGKGDTEARQATRKAFRAGVFYAKEVLQDEEAKAYYKQYGSSKRKVYHIAMSDYAMAPDIQEVNAVKTGNSLMLTIRAVDDTRVCSVCCEYGTANGRQVKQAEPDAINHIWQVEIALSELTENTIRIVAADLPGNETVEEWTVSRD
jgi:hypothetical protein